MRNTFFDKTKIKIHYYTFANINIYFLYSFLHKCMVAFSSKKYPIKNFEQIDIPFYMQNNCPPFDFEIYKKIPCIYDKHELYISWYFKEVEKFSHATVIYGNKAPIQTLFNFRYGIVKNMYSGTTTCFLLTTNNELYVASKNTYGQSGLGHRIYNNYFVKLDITKNHYFSYMKNNDSYNQFNSNIKNIFVNDNNTFIVMYSGDIYACGKNNYGQLGVGNYKNCAQFMQVYYLSLLNIKNIYSFCDRTYILTDNNQLYACGKNTSGNLGFGDYKYRNCFEKINYDFGVIVNITRVTGKGVLIINDKNECFNCDN